MHPTAVSAHDDFDVALLDGPLGGLVPLDGVLSSTGLAEEMRSGLTHLFLGVHGRTTRANTADQQPWRQSSWVLISLSPEPITAMTTNDKLLEAQAALTAGIKALVDSDGWTKYLETQARFHSYSFSNVMWLLAQASSRKVSVSQFAGYQTWLNLGRQVRKGEASFRVLAPCGYKKLDESTGEESFRIRGFRAIPTFDVSQTEGKPLPEVVTLLEGSSDELKTAFAKVTKSCEARGLKVERRELNGSANGFFSRTEKLIVVDSTLSDLQGFKTLCHETAHSLLHNTDEGDSRSTKEVEAESTAFVVLHALGLNSAEYSLGYVAVWAKGDTKLVQDVANRVQKTAKTIVTLFENKNEGAVKEAA